MTPPHIDKQPGYRSTPAPPLPQSSEGGPGVTVAFWRAIGAILVDTYLATRFMQ